MERTGLSSSQVTPKGRKLYVHEEEVGLYFPFLLSSGKNILDFPFLAPLSPLGVTAETVPLGHTTVQYCAHPYFTEKMEKKEEENRS